MINKLLIPVLILSTSLAAAPVFSVPHENTNPGVGQGNGGPGDGNGPGNGAGQGVVGGSGGNGGQGGNGGAGGNGGEGGQGGQGGVGNGGAGGNGGNSNSSSNSSSTSSSESSSSSNSSSTGGTANATGGNSTSNATGGNSTSNSTGGAGGNSTSNATGNGGQGGNGYGGKGGSAKQSLVNNNYNSSLYYPDWLNVAPNTSSFSYNSVQCQGATLNGAVSTLTTDPWNSSYGVQGTLGVSIPLTGQQECFAVQKKMREQIEFKAKAEQVVMCKQLGTSGVDLTKHPEFAVCAKK